MINENVTLWKRSRLIKKRQIIMESFWFGILIGVEVSFTILIGVIWFFFTVLGGKFNNWFILIIESIIAGIFWPITLIFLFKK